ncbi:hypothetical protein C8Q80DRAFT_28046 [Daedaleopsis nitida]|nr:hypothetical protein C8Q80DRAFT_28046 [Daedaleopsis nitida]
MGEISLHYIPDLSDASGIANFSDSSFQIPASAHHADDLLADNTIDFFSNANDALNTPAPPSRPSTQPPLTLAELTPRSKPIRAAPVLSSLRPRPGVTTPYRATVASELSAALSEELTPLRKQDPSFQIPSSGVNEDLPTADDGANFLGAEESSMDVSPPPPSLTVRHQVSSPSTRSTPTPEPSRLHENLPVESIPSGADSATPSLEMPPQSDVAGGDADCLSSPTNAILPNVTESVPGRMDADTVVAPDKGKSKTRPATNFIDRHKRAASGDKAKRKRVLPSAAVTKPAKLKPLTASLTRRLSSSGKKAVAAVRRRPMQAATSKSVADSARTVADKARQPALPQNDNKPFRSGGLAETLMSFGQKLIENTHKQDQREDTGSEPRSETVVDPDPLSVSVGRDVLSPPFTDRLSSADGVQPVCGSVYLTLSQLSPRKQGALGTTTVMVDSRIDEETLAPALDQPSPPAVMSLDRPPSPMRSSTKRTGSPVAEPQTHTRKRSKTTSGSSAPLVSKEPKSTLQPSRAKNVPAASTGSGPSGLSRTRRVVSATASVPGADRAVKTSGARKPAVPTSRSMSNASPVEEGGVCVSSKAEKPGPGLPVQSSRPAASSRNMGRSGHRSQRENLPNVQERSKDEEKHARPTSTTGDRQPPNSLPAKPTKPTEFQFATSTRLEARSSTKAGLDRSAAGAGSSSSLTRSRAHAHALVHPIPDFKALHAAQDSVLAQKRATGIHVTVPVEFGLTTESRAQERERFEEARRAREQELERLAEERRRERELEEEAEIRELRRRAVPKANEVPEWYAFAPKKAKADAGS